MINVHADGQGSVPGSPLIAVPYARRIELRNITGDLAASDLNGSGGPALQIGVDIAYFIPGQSTAFATAKQHIDEVIIDRVFTTQASPTKDINGNPTGIWQFGDIAKGVVSNLATALATATKVNGLQLATATGYKASYLTIGKVDFANISSGSEIFSWASQTGNTIKDSVGFDDEVENLSIASGATVVQPLRFAKSIYLQLVSGSATLTSMTNPSPNPILVSPRCTLFVPAGITISTAGSGAGSFTMSANLTGSNTASVTLQWRNQGNKWQEVSRTN